MDIILVFQCCFTRSSVRPKIAGGFLFPLKKSRLTELSSKRNVCIEPLFWYCDFFSRLFLRYAKTDAIKIRGPWLYFAHFFGLRLSMNLSSLFSLLLVLHNMTDADDFSRLHREAFFPSQAAIYKSSENRRFHHSLRQIRQFPDILGAKMKEFLFALSWQCFLHPVAAMVNPTPSSQRLGKVGEKGKVKSSRDGGKGGAKPQSRTITPSYYTNSAAVLLRRQEAAFGGEGVNYGKGGGGARRLRSAVIPGRDLIILEFPYFSPCP